MPASIYTIVYLRKWPAYLFLCIYIIQVHMKKPDYNSELYSLSKVIVKLNGHKYRVQAGPWQ